MPKSTRVHDLFTMCITSSTIIVLRHITVQMSCTRPTWFGHPLDMPLTGGVMKSEFTTSLMGSTRDVNGSNQIGYCSLRIFYHIFCQIRGGSDTDPDVDYIGLRIWIGNGMDSDENG